VSRCPVYEKYTTRILLLAVFWELAVTSPVALREAAAALAACSAEAVSPDLDWPLDPQPTSAIRHPVAPTARN